MPHYCAFLGHQPHISLAELCTLLPDIKVQKQWSPQIITFETKDTLDDHWLDLVGGTVLIAQELSLPSGAKKKNQKLEEMIPSLLYSQLKEVKRKAVFSFRCLSIPRSQIRSLYRLCKKHLKEKELSSRYIGNERNPAKPGTLLLRGIPGPNSCELVLLNDPKKKEIWIGKTCAVQDIESYTQRDIGKPHRDTKTGLMPPKLAQILLNFGIALTGESNWEKMTVWDPFCGTGVIMLEALLRRAHVLASDKTEKAVKGCTKNLKWMRNKEKTPKAITHHIWKQNALKECDLPKSPTLIVTETSLGPALKKSPTKKEIAALIREAEDLECGFFENMAHCRPDVPIVCTFPVYIGRDGTQHFLPKALEKIAKLGYRISCASNKLIRTTDRHSLLYLRPDQHVGREILCFLPPQKRERR